MFAPVFLVTAVKKVKRFGAPNKYTGSADARQSAWNVHLVDGFYKDFSYDLYFESEDQADKFSEFEIVGQSELIDAAPDSYQFIAGDVYKTFFQGSPNPYTGVKGRQDAWRVPFTGGYSGLRGIELQFPDVTLASQYAVGRPFSLTDLFGTLPSVPVNIPQRLAPLANKARLARAEAIAAQKILDDILAAQEAQKQGQYVIDLAEAAEDTAAAFKSYQDTQALYNLDPTSIMLAFLNQAQAGYLLGDDAGETMAATAWANANAQYQIDLAEKAEDTDAAHQYYRNTIDLYNLDPTTTMLGFVNAAKAGWLLGDDAGETQAGQAYSNANSQYLADVAAELAEDNAAALKYYQDTQALYNQYPTAEMLDLVNRAFGGYRLGDDAGEAAAAAAYNAAFEVAQDTQAAQSYASDAQFVYGLDYSTAAYRDQAVAAAAIGGDAGEAAAQVADANSRAKYNADIAAYNAPGNWKPQPNRPMGPTDMFWDISNGGADGFYDGIYYPTGQFSPLTGSPLNFQWFGTFVARH